MLNPNLLPDISIGLVKIFRLQMPFSARGSSQRECFIACIIAL